VRANLRLALPIMFTQLGMMSMGLNDTAFVGRVGETPLAAVGQAAQIFFLLQLVLFGINSGASMFTAQLWG